MRFRVKVYEVVKKIPEGKFLSYKEVAKRAGNEKAFRIVGNLMAQNKNPEIPCHRVIKNDNELGGYQGFFKNSWKKAALLLKEGAIGVIPTDTIYGVCGSAFKKQAVEEIYKLRRRNPKKPMIILISSFDDLHQLGVQLGAWQKKILKQLWPGKISVVLKCPSKKFKYLHQGTKTLALRLPKNKELIKILKVSGPLVAPSANLEGKKPVETINEARRYFKDKIFYYNKGELKGKASTLIGLTQKNIKVLRE